MVKAGLMEQLKTNFQGICEMSEILGVVLYGSYVRGEEISRSDIDICIVSETNPSLSLWNQILMKQSFPNEKYSIFFFHELPLYIKKDVFTEGIVICTPDAPRLYEFYFPYRKIWEDESFIIQNA